MPGPVADFPREIRKRDEEAPHVYHCVQIPGACESPRFRVSPQLFPKPLILIIY